MNHENAKERLSDYLDDELPYMEREDLRAHLRDCAPCRDELSGYEAGRSILARAFVPPTPTETEAFTRRILSQLRPSPELEFLDSVLSSPRSAVPAFALAAAILTAMVWPARSSDAYGPVDAMLYAQDNGRMYAWVTNAPAASASAAIDMEAR